VLGQHRLQFGQRRIGLLRDLGTQQCPVLVL
jgi:hypothetical protein